MEIAYYDMVDAVKQFKLYKLEVKTSLLSFNHFLSSYNRFIILKV